jgi:DNA-binding FadR family transcriptional regulator
MSFTRLFVEVVGEPMPYVHDDEAHQRLLQALQAREPQLAFERMYVHVSGMKSAMVSQEQLLRESTLV